MEQPAVVGRADAAAARSDLARRRGGDRPERPIPGARSRSAPLPTARERTSRSSPSTPRGSSSASSAPTARRSATSSRARTGSDWHALSPRRRPRAALRLPRPRALCARAGPPLQPGQAADRPLCARDRGRDRLGGRPRLRLPAGRRGRRRPRRRGRRRRDPEVRRRRPAASTGRATACSTRRGNETTIYELHVEGFTARHPDVREDLRGTYAGLASDAGDRVPERRSGSAPSSCCRSTTRSRRSSCTAAASTNYWGYSSIGYLAPHAALRRDRRPGRAGERVQGDGEGAPPRRDRGDPRRRLQPHRRERPPRADARLPRDRQRRLLPARRRPAPLRRLHRHRQHARHHAPERPAPRARLAALLGHRVPCRRLPLRPRRDARARPARLQPPLVLPLGDPSGSRALAGEADRRAVGPRLGRLPGRGLPARLVGVERRLPRHDARLLARADERRRVRRAVHGLARPVPRRGAARRGRRPTSSRRTTGSRSPTSSPTTASTTRRTSRTTTTAATTTARGTAAPRARPTTPR